MRKHFLGVDVQFSLQDRFCESIGDSTITETTSRPMWRIAIKGVREKITLQGTSIKPGWWDLIE